FGSDDDIVAVVKGTDRSQMEGALESVAAAVRTQPDLYDRLFYKVDLRSLHNRALLFLPFDQIKEIRENLGSMRLLLEFGPISWGALPFLSLLQEARHRAAVKKPSEPLSSADKHFLGHLRATARPAPAPLGTPAKYYNPWTQLLSQPPQQKDLLAEPQYFFS